MDYFRYLVWQEDSDLYLEIKGVSEEARACELIAGFPYFFNAVQFVKDYTCSSCCFKYRIVDTQTCREYMYEDIENEFK